MPEPALTEAQARLFDLILHGVKLGLDNITQLLAAVGHPHDAYPTVHVAGTNGKGSVLAFLDSALRESGIRTGRFTSPHLMRVNERFLIDGEPVSDAVLDEVLESLFAIAVGRALRPTFFEMCTAAAFEIFRRAEVDVALIEVGMGGRFDSTNVLAPEVCAITSIDLDHTQFLGDTRAKIAFEKAGILKPGTPCVVGPLVDEAQEVVDQVAREVGAPLWVAGRDYAVDPGGGVWSPTLTIQADSFMATDLPLGLAGAYQVHNAAIAALLAAHLRGRFPAITDASIERGLRLARWPGRLERVSESPPVILDAAHNPAGMAHYRTLFDRAIVVAAFSEDKDVGAMLDQLRPIADPLIITEYSGKRCADATALAAAHPGARAIPDLASALQEAHSLASADRPMLVTGSIYLTGEARSILLGERIESPQPNESMTKSG